MARSVLYGVAALTSIASALAVIVRSDFSWPISVGWLPLGLSVPTALLAFPYLATLDRRHWIPALAVGAAIGVLAGYLIDPSWIWLTVPAGIVVVLLGAALNWQLTADLPLPRR